MRAVLTARWCRLPGSIHELRLEATGQVLARIERDRAPFVQLSRWEVVIPATQRKDSFSSLADAKRYVLQQHGL